MNPVDFSSSLFAVAGKTAVVTGGTAGIGRMIAEGLVRSGMRVLIVSRKADACTETAAELARFGECAAVAADMSTAEGVESLADAVRERFDGRLNLLVNNAGATWGAPLEDFPDFAWDKVVNLNLTAVFRLTVALLDPLRQAASEDDPARVINIGSIAGMRVTELENYPYSASKAAVHMLTKHLARRLADESITVNAVAPGYFESRMSAFVFNDPESKRALDKSIPQGRTGRADDIVGTTVFLASRAGSYLTGAVIPLDGGVVDCT